MLDLIIEISLLILLIILGLFAILSMSVLMRIVRYGPSGIAALKGKGFGLPAFFKGDMPKQEAGANIEVIEGIELLARDGKIERFRQTRALSEEIL